jgi:hypothetical protein
MNFYWSMPSRLSVYFNHELSNYQRELLKNNFQVAWQHLERAHILGQPWAVEHTQVHWLMLKFGFRIKDTREIIGQLPRLLVGGVKSFVGKIPVGNTGGANVPPLQPMEIPHDLKVILDSNRL